MHGKGFAQMNGMKKLILAKSSAMKKNSCSSTIFEKAKKGYDDSENVGADDQHSSEQMKIFVHK